MTGHTPARVPRAMLAGLLRHQLPLLCLTLGLMLVQSLATLLQPWLGGVVTDRLMLGQALGGVLWSLFGLYWAFRFSGIAHVF